ncbi:MAG: peptidylprolyl isomerase [Bacteroidota bacterium]
MKKFLIINLFALLAFTSFEACSQNKDNKNYIVKITTNYGVIKVKLYNQTPLHRDNFVKLIGEKYFDSTLFHRVINQFMIQGGDPDSKKAVSGKMLGEGGPTYTIPAEIKDTLFHKKGVLAAARQGDEVNPKKESSGSQFYIVQGKIFTNQDLDAIENQKNMGRKQKIFNQIMSKPENALLKEKMIKYQQAQMSDSLQATIKTIEPLIESEFSKTPAFKFTPKQRQIYTTIGGTPHLDGDYTVFGEVIEGLDIVDKIAVVGTDKNNRPIQDVIMTITLEK